MIKYDILADYMDMRGMAFERIDGSVRGRDRQISIDRFTNKDSKQGVFIVYTSWWCWNQQWQLIVLLYSIATGIHRMIFRQWHERTEWANKRCQNLSQSQSYEHQCFYASLKLGLDQAILLELKEKT